MSLHYVARGLFACALALVVFPIFLEGSPSADASERKGTSRSAAKTTKSKSKSPSKSSGKGNFEYGCRVQKPQKSLERRHYMATGVIDIKKQSAAVKYLAERYGHVNDDVTRRFNGKAALLSASSVRFMGLPISVHSKIAPALACVEKRIQTTCGKTPYKPKAIGGFRGANTYRGVEVSNHLFGIALDIDPDRNPCCGCVDPWPNHPKCKKAAKSPYDRADMPKCWIQAFERYGFDWLGHDKLEDTMHFEFLGDPDRITK